jgi:hypothetical protein
MHVQTMFSLMGRHIPTCALFYLWECHRGKTEKKREGNAVVDDQVPMQCPKDLSFFFLVSAHIHLSKCHF